MTIKGLQLYSLVKEDSTLEIALAEVEMPEPLQDEVIVRVEATPLNPSDIGLLFGPADMRTATVSGTAERPVISAEIPDNLMRLASARLGKAMPVGNEGAGVVVAAGSSEAARALMGKTVGMVGGEMYAQYRCLKASMCMDLPEGTTPAQAASCFVNPLTALGMVETMRTEGHTALVHTAAASNLGQMLNRLCAEEGIGLVNIVRKAEQETLLRDLGASYVCNSTADTFHQDLTEALVKTGATLAFDAIGGGDLASQILKCMEVAANQSSSDYRHYGSDVYKQVYIYGRLDKRPTILSRDYGFSWGVGCWLLFSFVKKAGTERITELNASIAAGLKTTFASHYTKEISLVEVLSLQAIAEYSKQTTGEKFLIKPHSLA
ncbi:MAG: NADH oxidase [Gammaproteobacteria bacterium]|nr:MAG: NADH oxidase [Gammaproteobacteria bacterium]RLA58394.1 MAG: NADH oxidase [Gammaproteobacteria bacterium]